MEILNAEQRRKNLALHKQREGKRWEVLKFFSCHVECRGNLLHFASDYKWLLLKVQHFKCSDGSFGETGTGKAGDQKFHEIKILKLSGFD